MCIGGCPTNEQVPSEGGQPWPGARRLGTPREREDGRSFQHIARVPLPTRCPGEMRKVKKTSLGLSGWTEPCDAGYTASEPLRVAMALSSIVVAALGALAPEVGRRSVVSAFGKSVTAAAGATVAVPEPEVQAAFVLVMLLTAFLAIILMRVLKNGFTRYVVRL